ncbi:MAG: hydroxyacid dehydrogenase [Candidatus Cloacimonadota bacterium]|nr:MAG: hydroxyacid dehydrogenase [Candidatus Cloacimonadota bacterium]
MNIAVTSPSFSRHPILQKKVLELSPKTKLNTTGIRLKNNDLFEYIKNYEALIVGLETFDKTLLSRLPKLKVIAKYGVGLDNIDLEYCKKNNIHVAWKGGVNRLSVAELTLGFFLSLTHNLYQTSNLLKDGKWIKSGGFLLSQKTIGIIGIGHVAKELVKLLKPFGCKILVNDIINQDGYYQSQNLIKSSKKDIFKQSDIVSLHTPLTKQTFHLINKDTFKLMKENSFIINTARGDLINLKDLETALFNKLILGAAIDVYDQEPPICDKLLSHPNLINTPHIAGNAKEAILAMGTQAIIGLKEYYNV